MDLGTGDGRFVLATAAADPGRLVLGIDPVASAMADASRRAAQPARKGGLPNAAFVVAAAEALPPELAGIATRVTVNLPWGSLLRGALALPDAADATQGIASLVAPGGRLELLLAPATRDRLAPGVDVEARLAGSLAADWAAHGLVLEHAAPATADDLDATPTTWGRRLGLERARSGRAAATDARTAWRLRLHRPPAPPTDAPTVIRHHADAGGEGQRPPVPPTPMPRRSSGVDGR